MSKMLDILGKAIHQAIDEAPYMVRSNIMICAYEVKDKKGGVYFTHNDSEPCEDECDKLNDAWIARKAVEALKQACDDPEVYGNFNCEKLWKETTSAEVWKNWIDAILKA